MKMQCKNLPPSISDVHPDIVVPLDISLIIKLAPFLPNHQLRRFPNTLC